MEDSQKDTILGYAKILNPALPDKTDETLSYVADEVADRVMLYLNAQTINPALNRVIARIIVGIYAQVSDSTTTGGVSEREVKSVSDNGQSVSFGTDAKNYLATADDDRLFSGFAGILNRYREANCGDTGILQKSDS